MPTPMVSMERDDEEKGEVMQTFPALADQPDYPYGLRISLTERELDKLGLAASDCFVGGIVHIHGLARITSVSSEDREGGKTERVELQIEDMCCVESEDAENSAAEKKMDRKNPLHDNARSDRG